MARRVVHSIKRDRFEKFQGGREMSITKRIGWMKRILGIGVWMSSILVVDIEIRKDHD
jgi:hypothetical protein